MSERDKMAIDSVAELYASVHERYEAYVAFANAEFKDLKGKEFVKASFEPVHRGPYAENYTSREEKYRGMRGAYYRAGWAFIKDQVLDQIVPTTYFGVKVGGGTHKILHDILVSLEQEVGKKQPNVARRIASIAPAFIVGGFNPRFQRGSTELSNHAYGLAIDVDFYWNPQVRTPDQVRAFKQATGVDFSKPFFSESSQPPAALYLRLVRISDSLKKWLSATLLQYDQLVTQRDQYRKERNRVREIAALDAELKNNPDLAALGIMIHDYERRIVDAWKIYGIITIDKEIIDIFSRLGTREGARWGGEYRDTKDVMHLELLPKWPGRRPPVRGFADLMDPTRLPTPVNGPK